MVFVRVWIRKPLWRISGYDEGNFRIREWCLSAFDEKRVIDNCFDGVLIFLMLSVVRWSMFFVGVLRVSFELREINICCVFAANI